MKLTGDLVLARQLLNGFLEVVLALLADNSRDRISKQNGPGRLHFVLTLDDQFRFDPHHSDGIPMSLGVPLGKEQAYLSTEAKEPAFEVRRSTVRSLTPRRIRMTVSITFFGPPEVSKVSFATFSSAST